jgi:uncharacterized membrane protein YcaP (DUF421 family)
VLLGAVLSRAVVGASPFWATIFAAAALALLHRLLALACVRWKGFEDIVSGREIELVRNGRVDHAALRRALLTERNLAEAIRQKLGSRPIDEVEVALLERDGKVTVIGKQHREAQSS